MILNVSGRTDIVAFYTEWFMNRYNDKYNIDYHIKAFSKLCSLLNGYVKRIIISFLDEYKNVKENRNILKYKILTDNDYKLISRNFSKIASNNGMTVQTCFEDRNK